MGSAARGRFLRSVCRSSGWSEAAPCESRPVRGWRDRIEYRPDPVGALVAWLSQDPRDRVIDGRR